MGGKCVLYFSVLVLILYQTEANILEESDNILSQNRTGLILDDEDFNVNKTTETDADLGNHRLSKRATSKFDPCPGVYEYVTEFGSGFGRITLGPDNYPVGQNFIYLVVEYSLPAFSNYEGSLDLLTSLNEIGPLLAIGGDINFRVNYPVQYPTPWINSIIVNGRKICIGVSEYGSVYRSPISLSRIVNLSSNIRKPIKQITTPTTSAPPQVVTSDASNSSDSPEDRYISPCPKILEYKQDDSKKFYGWIKLNKYPLEGNVEVKVNFIVNKKLKTEDHGKLEMASNGIIYKVIFPTQDPVPLITSIEINGISICQRKTDTESGMSYSLVHKSIINRSTTTKPKITEPTKSKTGPKTPIKEETMYANILKYKDICGKSTRIQTLISFGSETNPGDFPWLTPLFSYQDDGGIKFICGGNLISTKHVLTAAHCIRENADNYAVIPGLHDLRKLVSSKLYPIRDIITHPDYGKKEETTADGDIAILVLEEQVTFSRRIKPICLPIEAIPLVKKEGLIAGWGDTEYNRRSRVVREATLPIVPTDQCIKHDSRYISVSSNRTFCAGGGPSTPCAGDSGGGFFIEQGDRMYVQGIVSLSIGKHGGGCDSFTYSVFAKVFNYLDWINNSIN